MKTTILSSTFVLGLLAALSVAGCAKGELVDETSAPCASEEKSDILDTAINAGSFTMLARAIEAADLSETLRGAGPFTVFAPTDEAFSRLPAGTLDNLLLPENKENLRSLLLGHVASGWIDSSHIASMSAIPMLAGRSAAVGGSRDETTLDGVALVHIDIVTSNGVFHIIGAVILPEEPATSPQEPEVKPQEPGINLQEPVSRQQEPGINLQEPVSRQQEPGINLQEPVTNPQEPGSQLQEPGAQLQEPGAQLQEPGAQLQEPGAQLQEPGAQLQEPGAQVQEPASVPEEPATPPEKKQGCPNHD